MSRSEIASSLPPSCLSLLGHLERYMLQTIAFQTRTPRDRLFSLQIQLEYFFNFFFLNEVILGMCVVEVYYD